MSHEPPDQEALRVRMVELEALIAAPGFWDDALAAKRVCREHAELDRQLRPAPGRD